MPPADLVILGAAVRTLDPARPPATAVAVADGVIVAVGDDAEVREHAGAGDGDRRRARHGARPGLVDSHIHPSTARTAPAAPTCRGSAPSTRSAAPCAKERARCAPGEWVLGWGLPYDAFGPGVGAAADRRATGESPAYLTSSTTTPRWSTQPALALAGIDGARDFDAGGAVVVDARGRADRRAARAAGDGSRGRSRAGADARPAPRRLRRDAARA